MKWLNFERLMMLFGALSALFAVFNKYDEGINSYGWPLGAIMWILVTFLKDQQIRSLTKNK